jgi:hypothetical protein
MAAISLRTTVGGGMPCSGHVRDSLCTHQLFQTADGPEQGIPPPPLDGVDRSSIAAVGRSYNQSKGQRRSAQLRFLFLPST